MSQATAPTPDKVVVGPVDAAQETVLTSRVQRELLCEIHSGFCAVGDVKLLEDEVLPYRKTDRQLGTRVYQIPQASICQRCACWGAYTTAKSGRAIVRHRAEVVKHQFEAQFQEPASQAIYRRRKTKVEHPFGHLKRNLGVTSFLLRGLAGVRAETSLLATAFNLRRLITLLGVTGVQEQLATA